MAGIDLRSPAGTTNAASGAPAVNVISAAGASQALAAPTDGTETLVKDVTLSGASCAFTITGGNAGKRTVIELYLTQDSTGGRLATWPSNIIWSTGAPPTLSSAANRTDMIQFISKDGGTSWLGNLVGAGFILPAVPGAPTSLSVSAGNAVATVTWFAPTNASPTVTGYKLYRGTSAGGETLLTTLGNVTIFNDTGLTNGTTYYYKVSALNSIGEGVKSAEASGTPTVSSSLPSFRRTVTDGVTASGSPTVTSATANFTSNDVGRPISGTGIPANAFIGVVNSATSIGLSSAALANTAVNASASGTAITLTIGSVAALWYKADALALADGAAVSSWTDSSASAINATQATGSQQPIFKTNQVASLPVVRFASASSQVLATTKNWDDGMTAFAVVKLTATGTPVGILGSNAANGYSLRVNSTSHLEIDKTNALNLQTSTGAVPNPTTQFSVVAFWTDPADGTSIRQIGTTINGTAQTASAAGHAAGGIPINVGMSNPASNYWNGDIAEVIYYPMILPATDRKAVEQYLGTKYGITVAP